MKYIKSYEKAKPSFLGSLDTDDYKKNFILAEFFEDRFISELDYKANKYNL